MISVLIAIGVWLHMLLPMPLNLFSAAALIVFTFYRFRQSLTLLLAALFAAQIALSLGVHKEMASIASNFESAEATFVALETGGTLTKVQITEMPSCATCVGAKGQTANSLAAGQTMTGRFLFRPHFTFGEFVAKGHGKVSPAPENPLVSIRSAFLSSLGGLSTEAKALVAGLAIGDTSLFTEGFKTKLKQLSLTHLNAVSGANCAIVVGVVYWALGFILRKRFIRGAVAVLALVGYVALVGGGASVVRAAVMATLVLLAVARGTWPLAALSMTATVMLLFDPNYARDYGFALSVLATAGILILAPALAKRFEHRLGKPLALALSVTVAAQLWCMPVLLNLQDGIPTYAVLANLLVDPVVAPITVLGIFAALLAWPLPAVATALTFLASVPAQWIVAVSKKLVTLPAVSLDWHTGIIGMAVLVIALSAWLLTRKRLHLILFSIILVIELAFAGATVTRSVTWLPSDWQIVNCDVGQGDALVVRDHGSIAVIDVGREEGPIDECLRWLGVTSIDLLVLTHYDMDHIGGLSGALNGRRVESALVTPFPDIRDAAKIVLHKLRVAKQVISGAIGVTGMLGETSWQVLSPTASASEAEDSNDGSIVMRWISSNWTLYTMADLGERGQMRMAARMGANLAHPTSGPLILKVSHHGSADQYLELIEAMHPDLALVSVGKKNSYGHPTKRLISCLERLGTTILRTDRQGALAVYGNLQYAVSGGG